MKELLLISALILAFYGYILVEMKKPEEAVRVLEKAIKYNPVNTGPRFEMAECFKVLRNPQSYLKRKRNT